MNLFERLAWVADTVHDQLWLHRHLRIGPTDLVLDVGSGGSPNLRANVLCDKFVLDATERNGHPLLVDRPFIVADAERLPFPDHAFDFVICSHVLEHVNDPSVVLRELQRVAPRGYIETPSANWEKVQGFPFHRWLVSVREGVLCFDGKSSRFWDEDLRSWFRDTQRLLGTEERLWFARRQIGVYTSLLWEGSIPYEIRDAHSAAEGLFAHAEVIPSEVVIPSTEADRQRVGGIAARAIRRYGAFLRRASDRPWAAIEHLLCCPDCRRTLQRVDGIGYRCSGCGADFPLDGDGHPWLLRGRTEVEPLTPSRHN